MQSWESSDGFDHLADLLSVALSVNSDSQAKAVDLALGYIQSAVSREVDATKVRELAEIVELALHYFNNTRHSVKINQLAEVFTQSSVLPFLTLCKAGIATIRFEGFSLRDIVEKIFTDRATGNLQPEIVRAGVEEIVKGLQIAELARDFLDLEFGINDPGDYPAACKRFLRLCFCAERPLLLLLISPSDLSGRENCRLVKVEEIEGPASPRGFKDRINRYGVQLTEPSLIGSYLSEDFLEREVKARAVSKGWLNRRLSCAPSPEDDPHNPNSGGVVVPFQRRGLAK
jgi:hypothetical protein